jgi:hypothetical protein
MHPNMAFSMTKLSVDKKNSSQNEMWFFKQKWNLAIFAMWMWGSLKIANNLKGVTMLEMG